MSAAVMPYQQGQTAGAPPGSITGIGPNTTNGPYGGPPGAGGPSASGPYFGPPPKDKGPSLGEVVSDNLSVSMAKVTGGSHKAVDIAIIKATTAKFAVVPKEKHVRTLKHAVHGGQPGSYAGYVIDKLQQRLRNAKHWLCALKTLMVFHRLMRESEGASFVAELLRFSGHGHGRGYVLNMDSFTDSGSSDGKWDYSEWVRVYARYLDEQLEVYSKTAFYQEPDGSAPAESKMRNLPPAELLAQLPPLQKLLERLMDCLPRGLAARHFVVQASLLTVAKESFQIYRAISEGIINLADCFFDMEYIDAQKGLEIYKQHTIDNDKLGAYYAQAEQIEELKRSATFPKLTPPSPDFLGMMEEYVEQAPRHSTGARSSPLRKGRGAKEEEKTDDLPPVVDSGLTGVIHPEEEEKKEEEEAPPPTPPAPEPEMDLLNFDEPDEPAASPPPPREKTATELLQEEQAAAAAAEGAANGHSGQQQFAPQQPPSNNPFGEGSAFGQQQQQQQPQPGSLHAGAVVPYGQNTFGGGGPGWGAPYGQGYGYQQQGYGYGQPGYGQYGGYGGAPIQPGQMVPYGLQSPGYGSPGFGQPSPSGSFNNPGAPSPYATTPGGNPTQSFKEAALNDPFADLGSVRPSQPAVQQTTPPLREVSPTQQRINLGLRQSGQGGFPQQQPQQGQWQQGQQQPQQNGWGAQQNGGFATFPPSPAQGPPHQQWGQ